MANENRTEKPGLDDESPLFWLSKQGGDVRYHLDRVHAIAQILLFADLQTIDQSTIPILIGVVLDDVNAAVSTLERGSAS